jgi:peptidoglycan/xylan/chitin deacetylase (PgdA/CDA1 family)
MMRWSEARAAIAAGTFEVHCHTHSHTRWLRAMTWTVRSAAPASAATWPVKQTLLEKLGEVSDTLCWPYGDFDDDYIEVAREQGFRYLHTTHPVRPQRDWRRSGAHLSLRDPQPPGQLAAQAHRGATTR